MSAEVGAAEDAPVRRHVLACAGRRPLFSFGSSFPGAHVSQTPASTDCCCGTAGPSTRRVMAPDVGAVEIPTFGELRMPPPKRCDTRSSANARFDRAQPIPGQDAGPTVRRLDGGWAR